MVKEFELVHTHNFSVKFTDFGDQAGIEFGQFVSTIGLPSLSFEPQQRFYNSRPVQTVGENRWNPVHVSLLDDNDNVMIGQVIRQIKKQRTEPRTSLFGIEITLWESGVLIRRYRYKGCTILQANHDRELDHHDPNRMNFVMYVQVDDVDVFGRDLQEVGGPLPIDEGTTLGEVYDPIGR